MGFSIQGKNLDFAVDMTQLRLNEDFYTDENRLI